MLRWPDATLYEGVAEVAEDRPEAPALYADEGEECYGHLDYWTKILIV